MVAYILWCSLMHNTGAVPDAWRGEHWASDGGGPGADGCRQDEARPLRDDRDAEAAGAAVGPGADRADPADGRGDAVAAYLPAGMAARLDAAPEALRAPKHPSQVAFEALCAATQFDNMPAALGLGRRARAAQTRLGAGGAVADDARALALHGRESGWRRGPRRRRGRRGGLRSRRREA